VSGTDRPWVRSVGVWSRIGTPVRLQTPTPENQPNPAKFSAPCAGLLRALCRRVQDSADPAQLTKNLRPNRHFFHFSPSHNAPGCLTIGGSRRIARAVRTLLGSPRTGATQSPRLWPPLNPAAPQGPFPAPGLGRQAPSHEGCARTHLRPVVGHPLRRFLPRRRPGTATQDPISWLVDSQCRSVQVFR
jgi:hypothetical protein